MKVVLGAMKKGGAVIGLHHLLDHHSHLQEVLTTLKFEAMVELGCVSIAPQKTS